jgi:hypothetical protein
LMLAAHKSIPREGHLRALFRVFAYLKGKHNARLIFYHSYSSIHHEKFKENKYCVPSYEKITKVLPMLSVVLRTFVDSDHAGNLLTRRSQTSDDKYVGHLMVFKETRLH